VYQRPVSGLCVVGMLYSVIAIGLMVEWVALVVINHEVFLLGFLLL